MKSPSRVQLFATPWTAAHQAPPSMGFSRQEYWSGVPSPSPELTRGSTNTYEDKVLYIREYVLVEICLAVPASPVFVCLFLSNSFIFGCAVSLMQSTGLSVAAHRLSLVAVSGGYSLVEVHGVLVLVTPLGEHWL